MIERPILFSGAMVRAILEGRKTQTRRIVKPQPKGSCPIYLTSAGAFVCDDFRKSDASFSRQIKCPYGRPGSELYGPGDRLWVRETWAPPSARGPYSAKKPENCTFKADGRWNLDGTPIKYKPSIHMPRWASRITLEVTGVRVERLHEISEADALAEGVPGSFQGEYDEPQTVSVRFRRGDGHARDNFADLWNAINGLDAWSLNPWVWVVEFKRTEDCHGR